MPDATITSTASTFGTITGTFAADQSTVTGTVSGIITGTLSGSVGVPGPQGQPGPQGPEGPPGPPGEGGTWGSIVGTLSNQTDLQNALDAKQNVSGMSAYLTKAGNLSGLTDLSAARDNLQLGVLYSPTFAGLTIQGSGANVANLTSTSLSLSQVGHGQFTIQPSQGIVFPDASIQTTAFPTGSDMPTGGLTGQALVKQSNANYDADWATIAGLPPSGTIGQVLTKNSGTSYDASWQSFIPGDRYVTTSSTSLSVSNGSKSLTIGTGLAYTPTQDVTIALTSDPTLHHMHGPVVSYNSGTGALVVDVQNHTGSGTYSSWTVNVGGTVPLQTVEWGEILGTLGDQTDLATALNAKLDSTDAASTYLAKASNLSDLTNANTARNNLGLGTSQSVEFGAVNVNFGSYALKVNDAASFSVQLNTPAIGGYVQKSAMAAGGLSASYTTYGDDGMGNPVEIFSRGGFVGAGEISLNVSDYATSINSSVTVSALTKTIAISNGDDGSSVYVAANSGVNLNGASGFYGPNACSISADNGFSHSLAIYPTFPSVSLNATSGLTINGETQSVAINSTTLSPILSGSASTYRSDLGLGTMATESAGDYSTTAVANGLYYPLSSNPAGYLTSASLSGYATQSWVTSQGYITSSALTGYATESWVTSQGYITSAALTPYLLSSTAASTYAALSGATFTGEIVLPASTTTTASLTIPHGSAPTTPVNGEVWTTTSGLFVRVNGTTRQYVDLDGTQTINGAKTFSNANQTLGNSTATGTINVGTGATLSGSTKTVNVATGGVAGSTTNVVIGSTTGTSTTTLQGITNGVTLAADTNSTALATTAYVVGQAGSATPLVNGTAAAGTSLRYARQDHVHPTDTSRLAAASNLSDLANAGTARTNLGLGTIATANDAPSDGTTYGRNNGAWVAAGGGGGASTDYQTFTTAGTFTWTKPAGAKWVEVLMFSGGGGGGSGARQATSANRCGGGGGSGGTYAFFRIPASGLGATSSVVVGAGGAGGTSIAIDNTNGNNGSNGGDSTFFGYKALGGAGGTGGTGTTASGGSGRAGYNNGQSVGGSSGLGGAGNNTGGTAAGSMASTSAQFACSGGGGGGGAAAASTTAAAGGAGGQKILATGTTSGLIATISGGAAGTTGGVSPTTGVSFTTSGTGSTGGGGGAYITAVSGQAGAAGVHGSGGGGGSASDNGFASGAGGAGGTGAVYIITYC